MTEFNYLPELPSGWVYAQLGDLIEPSKEKIDPSATDSLCYIGLEHIEKKTGKIISSGTSKEVTSTKSIFFEGDLLYGKLRPYLNKVCVPDFKGVCSTDILVFNKSANFSSKYLKYRMLSPDFVRFANQNATGVNHPRVDYKKISTFRLMLPPLAEQHRIIVKIEELLTKIDAGVESLKKAEKRIKYYRKATLQSAIEGKLTEEWRLSNPFCKIHLKGEEGPYNIPSSWKWVKLKNIINSLSYGILKPGDFDPNGIPMVRVLDIGEYGLNNTSIFKVSPEIAQNYNRTKVEPGNILLSIMATVGRCIVAPHHFNGYNVNRAISVIKLSNDVNPYYICNVLRSQFIQNKFNREKIGTAQARINLNELKEFAFPIPPIEEQNEIVSKIDSAFSILDRIESNIQSDKYIDKMYQSIFKNAFSGKLVPQDPGDEPAEKLLERIRAERAHKAGSSQASKARKARKQTTLA